MRKRGKRKSIFLWRMNETSTIWVSFLLNLLEKILLFHCFPQKYVTKFAYLQRYSSVFQRLDEKQQTNFPKIIKKFFHSSEKLKVPKYKHSSSCANMKEVLPDLESLFDSAKKEQMTSPYKLWTSSSRSSKNHLNKKERRSREIIKQLLPLIEKSSK